MEDREGWQERVRDIRAADDERIYFLLFGLVRIILLTARQLLMGY